MVVHKAVATCRQQFICYIEVCMAKNISLIGSQEVVALNLKGYMFDIIQQGFEIRYLNWGYSFWNI